jgi:hypothetical protein
MTSLDTGADEERRGKKGRTLATQLPEDAEIQFSDTGAGRAFDAGIDLQGLVDALRRPHFSQSSDEGPERRVHFLKLDGIPTKIVTATNDDTPERHVIVTVVALDASGHSGDDMLRAEPLEGNLRVAG